MITEKPDWLKLKELHDAEMIDDGFGGLMPKSRGRVYGPPDSLVDQVGDGLIDVNHLMSRFEKTGKLEELIAAGVQFDGGGSYGDFTNVPDYEEALKISMRAAEQFSMLNAKIRNRFDNDPRQFLAFVNNPANGDELIEMGLRKRPVPAAAPETTLKDVVEAVKESSRSKKTSGKGGEEPHD